MALIAILTFFYSLLRLDLFFSFFCENSNNMFAILQQMYKTASILSGLINVQFDLFFTKPGNWVLTC